MIQTDHKMIHIDQKTISVIICTYSDERWDDLVAAVESLRQQVPPPDEIIVVVDHNLALWKRIRAYFPDIVVIENSEPRGLSGARNSGISVACGELIAFLDDDAVAEPDWLARLSEHCMDERVIGVGGTVVPFWLSEQPRWFPKEFYWVIGCTYQRVPEGPVIVRNPYGGCACIKRKVFKLVGGFRDGIGRVGKRPLGGEETELSIRASQYWSQCVFLYEPQAKIHHRIPAARTTWRYFIARCYAEGLSKAIIAYYVGSKAGLSSERSYILRTLPMGIMRGICDLIFKSDIYGIKRSFAIIAGLSATVTGYIVGKVSYWSNKYKKNKAHEG